MSNDTRLRIAVFIDFDNIEIGVKNTLGSSFDAGLVLEALKERGEVVSKTAYSDWQRAGGYSRQLTQHAIKMVQRNLTPGGDKNGADINLALDALEMALTHPHINAFVIVGGDSDFISLVEKLKQYDKKVFVVGGRQFTSAIMQRNCHEFIAYEHLAGAAAASGGGRRQPGQRSSVERAPIEQAIPLVTRALKVLSEREVSPQMGLLKSTLLQLDSTFSERSFGAGSFRDFVEKLARLDVVKLHHAKGGILVELVSEGATPGAGLEGAAEEGESARVVEPLRTVDASAPVAVIGTPADGVAEFRRVLGAAPVARWPMYLRNVKQHLRQHGGSFDERAYGFTNLVELLRAAQKESLVRVERDRQGVLRIFQGAEFPKTDENAVVVVASASDAGAEISPADVEVIVAEVVELPADGAAASEATPAGKVADEPEDDQISVLGPKLHRDPEELRASAARKQTGGGARRRSGGRTSAPRSRGGRSRKER